MGFNNIIVKKILLSAKKTKYRSQVFERENLALITFLTLTNRRTSRSCNTLVAILSLMMVFCG